MSDLIDRQAAITAICEDGTWLESQGCTEITMCERKQRDADILSELPTIDAVEKERYDRLLENSIIIADALRKYQSADMVEVVRCKDCKHRVYTDDGESCPDDIVCDLWESDGFTETDYCSWGERRPDAD